MARSAVIRRAVWCLLVLGSMAVVVAQAQSGLDKPNATFDVVSVRRNATRSLNSSVNERPDGGLTMLNVPVGTLIARAYPPAIPLDMVGLPAWGISERYDVRATASLRSPTKEQKQTMLRTMLAERFGLRVHVERRVQRGYELVLARDDRRLGAGIRPSGTDCGPQIAAAAEARKAGVPAPPLDMKGPVPPCIVRATDDGLEGDTTLAGLAILLRQAVREPVGDRTGLEGYYRITLKFDRTGNLTAPVPLITASSVPSVFTAVQEQLGMKLERAQPERDVLIIDRIERPSDD